jgi:hypothetical protein
MALVVAIYPFHHVRRHTPTTARTISLRQTRPMVRVITLPLLRRRALRVCLSQAEVVSILQLLLNVQVLVASTSGKPAVVVSVAHEQPVVSLATPPILLKPPTGSLCHCLPAQRARPTQLNPSTRILSNIHNLRRQLTRVILCQTDARLAVRTCWVNRILSKDSTPLKKKTPKSLLKDNEIETLQLNRSVPWPLHPTYYENEIACCCC